MHKMDKVSKRYLSDPDRFADCYNAVICHGKQIIKAENIQEKNSESIFMGEDNGRIESFSVERDIVREAVLESHIILIAIESQTGIHYAMPLRIMQGDVLQYHDQMQRIIKEHKKKKDLRGDEYLSGFSKKDKLIPVTTICVYWGKEPWDGPRCLKDMMELSGLQEDICEKISDYPLNLIEVNQLENLDIFKTDLRLVFGFLQKRENKEKLRDFIKENEDEFQDLAEDAYDFLSTVTHSKELAQMREEMKKSEKENIMQEGRKINMCKAIKDMIEDGRQEGRQEGIKEGERRTINILKLNILGKSIEDISKECEMTEKQVEEIINMFAS